MAFPALDALREGYDVYPRRRRDRRHERGGPSRRPRARRPGGSAADHLGRPRRRAPARLGARGYGGGCHRDRAHRKAAEGMTARGRRRSSGARVSSERRPGSRAADRRAAGLPSASLDGRASCRSMPSGRSSSRSRANSSRSGRRGRSSRTYRSDSVGGCQRRPSCSRLIRRCCATAASRPERARRCARSRRGSSTDA